MKYLSIYLFGLLLLTSGCSNLSSIPQNECGNRVLEENEDCDGTSVLEGGTCGSPDHLIGACTYICDQSSSPKVECPQNWVCGLDNRCRKHDGFETQAIRLSDFTTEQLDVADFDGDAYLDIMGTRDNRIKIRYGEPEGEFEEQLEFSSVRPIGPLDYGDFDQDGHSDILVPVRHGLHMLLGSSDRELTPAIYQPIEIDSTRSAQLLALEADSGFMGTEIVVMQGSNMAFQRVDQGKFTGRNTPLPLNKIPSQILGDIPVTDLGIKDQRQEFALSFSGSVKIWIFTSTGSYANNDLQIISHSEVDLPMGMMTGDGVDFADINGDGFDDLVISTRDLRAEREGLAVSYWSSQTNEFSRACLIQFPLGMDGLDVSSIPLPLAFADLNRDQRADFVTREGVWINPLTTSQAVCGRFPAGPKGAYFSSPDEWEEAKVGDFNGDQNLDVAVLKSSAREILLLLGDGSGIFNPVEIETNDYVRQLSVGDFDGDFVDDVALVEPREASSSARLSVLFGQNEHEDFKTRFMGAFKNIQNVIPVLVPGGSPSFDGISDLIVTSTKSTDDSGENRLAVAIMYGNSERQLLSPFLLRTSLTDETKNGLDNPQVALMGDFCHYCASQPSSVCASAPDLATIAWSVSQRGIGDMMRTNPASKPYLWLLSGHLASDSPTSLDFTEGAFRRTEVLPPSPFDLKSTCWAKADLDSDERQELIGIDNAFACFQATPPTSRLNPSRLLVMDVSTSENSCNGEIQYKQADLPSSFRNPSVLKLSDVDNDGDKDLVVGFRGDGDLLSTRGSGVVVMWNTNGEFVSSESTTLPESQAVRDVSIINMGPDVMPAIVVVSRASSGNDAEFQKPYGVLFYQLDLSERTFLPPIQLAETRLGDRLVTRDLNGNGLEDMAWTEGEFLRILYAREGQNKP